MSDSDFDYRVDLPNSLYTAVRSFKAIANGKIYVGKVDTDPTIPSNQVTVYLVNEDGSTVPIPQPIIINAGGHPVYNGQIISKIVTDDSYSLAVYDAYGSQEYYFPNIDNVNANAAITTLLNNLSGRLFRLNTVADMKAFNVQAGYVYQTEGYYAVGDFGGALYMATTSGDTPDGYGDHVASNGVFLRLISQPTDLNHGIKINATFDPDTAWFNRNCMQSLLRNERWSYFTFKAKGTVYALSGVNIGRDNITVEIQKGCRLVGRFDDPSIPESTISQAGGFIVFAHYFDPDNGDFVPWQPDDTRVNPPILNVNVILDGEVSTEFNSVHSNQNNNLAIGMMKAQNCSVKGAGGIGQSDHRGINFEGIGYPETNKGGAINCHIDISYCYNVVNNCLMISGDVSSPSLQTISVGSVNAMISGGYDNPMIFRVSDGSDFEVRIGRFLGDNIVKPAVVGAYNARSVKLNAGLINGARNLIYSNGTLYLEVQKVGGLFNTQVGVVRGETTSGGLLGVKVSNIMNTDSNFIIVYSDVNHPGPFARLDISNNNFGSCGSGFTYFGGKNSAALPVIDEIKDNVPPVVGATTVVELNYRTKGTSGNLATAGAPSTTINFKNPDWLYSKLSFAVQIGGVLGAADIDLRSRLLTNNPVTYKAGDYNVVTTVSGGNTIVLTPSGGAVMAYAQLHN